LPGWDHVPLADLLLTEFCLPVSLNNDANAAALGEWLYGAGRGHHNLVYVTISTGIGAGVICNDTLLVGAHGSAAEVGHLCLQAVGGEPCGCGRLGCFEAYASGTGMVRRTRERLAGSQESSVLRAQTKITPQRIAEAARQQDQFAQAIIQETTECLGIGLANVLSLYDPSVLVLGGGLTNLWSELVAPAVSAMRRLTFAPNADHLLVTRPVLGDDAGLIGAGALVSYQLGRQ
jgi:glucokinase